MDGFAALAAPTRRVLLAALLDGERSAGELAAVVPAVSQPTVSRHLRVLLDAGLVDVQPDAQRRLYVLRRQGFVEIDDWITQFTS
jgi:DNA-binding transcriptional ArsR family regulator